MKVVCSVGTTEPHNAVGLGLDARVLRELGVRPVSVVAGVSAQDARGLHAAAAIAPELIEAQLAALEGAGIDAYRIGALLEAASAETIARRRARFCVPVVYDPVAAASVGGSFADEALLHRIAELVLPIVTVFTPNLAEASMLLGVPVRSMHDMPEAARALAALPACAERKTAILLKGGHLNGQPCDVLAAQGETHVFSQDRLAGEMRGTGCTLAAALAAELAQGSLLIDAVRRARAFVRKKISEAELFAGMLV